MSDALIHALLIDKSGAVETLDWNGVRTWTPDKGLLWVHLNAAAAETKNWVTQELGLPTIVPPSLLADETRPRAHVLGDGVVLALRGVNLNPDADPEDMVAIRLWVEADRVISARRRPLISMSDLVESLKQRPVTGPGDLIVRLADAAEQRMSDVIDDLEKSVSDLEQIVMQEPDQACRSSLGEVRKTAIALRRHLAPQREALGRLQGEPLPWLTDTDRFGLREVNDRLIRHVEDLDAIRDRAAVIQGQLMSELSDQLNRRMYVLSVVAAVFLPLGFLTGLLGVNVGGIPGTEHPYGFLIFSLILVVLVAVQLWYFTIKRWF